MAIFQAAKVAFGVLAALYLLALSRGMPENEVRALTFVSLVRSFPLRLSSAHAQPASHFQPCLRRALWWVAVVTLSLLSLILAWSPARELFRFGPLHANDLIATLTATALLVVTLEMVKRFWRMQGQRKN